MAEFHPTLDRVERRHSRQPRRHHGWGKEFTSPDALNGTPADLTHRKEHGACGSSILTGEGTTIDPGVGAWRLCCGLQTSMKNARARLILAPSRGFPPEQRPQATLPPALSGQSCPNGLIRRQRLSSLNLSLSATSLSLDGSQLICSRQWRGRSCMNSIYIAEPRQGLPQPKRSRQRDGYAAAFPGGHLVPVATNEGWKKD